MLHHATSRGMSKPSKGISDTKRKSGKLKTIRHKSAAGAAGAARGRDATQSQPPSTTQFIMRCLSKSNRFYFLVLFSRSAPRIPTPKLGLSFYLIFQTMSLYVAALNENENINDNSTEYGMQ